MTVKFGWQVIDLNKQTSFDFNSVSLEGFILKYHPFFEIDFRLINNRIAKDQELR